MPLSQCVGWLVMWRRSVPPYMSSSWLNQERWSGLPFQVALAMYRLVSETLDATMLKVFPLGRRMVMRGNWGLPMRYVV